MRRLTFLRRFSGPTRLGNLRRTGMNQIETPPTKLRKILTTAMIMKIMMTNLTAVILIILTTIRMMRIKPQTKLLPRQKPQQLMKLLPLMKLHMKKQQIVKTATACGF